MRVVRACLCLLAAWVLPAQAAHAQLPVRVIRLFELAEDGRVVRVPQMLRVGAAGTVTVETLESLASTKPLTPCVTVAPPQLAVLDEVVAEATKAATERPYFDQELVENRLERALGILKAHNPSAMRGPYVLDYVAAIDAGALLEPEAQAYLLAVSKGEVDYGTPLVWDYMRGGGRAQVRHLLTGHVEVPPAPHVPDPFWNANAPALVTNYDGSLSALTYSTDAELPIAEAWRLLTGDPDLFRHYGDTISRARLEEIAKQEGLSGIESFLPRGKPLKSEYEIHELLLHDDWLFNKPLGAQVRMRAMGFPVVMHWDGLASLELTHESFETVPSQFRDLMRKVHDTLENPQTHLHLGVPGTAVTPAEVDAIARAIETRGVLQHALEPLSFGVPRSGSARGVLNTYGSGYSGPIQVVHNRWGSTHDIELRQWDHREGDYLVGGMNLIAFGSRLAQQPARLVIRFGHYGWGDRSAMNLSGALRYGGEMLSHDVDPAIANIGTQMQALADRADQFENGLPADFRIEVRTFLQENRVDDLLADEEVWMGETRPLSERRPHLDDLSLSPQ